MCLAKTRGSAKTSSRAEALERRAAHIIPLINSIREQKTCLFCVVMSSLNFHPSGQISFGSTHGLDNPLRPHFFTPDFVSTAASQTERACRPTAVLAKNNMQYLAKAFCHLYLSFPQCQVEAVVFPLNPYIPQGNSRFHRIPLHLLIDY